MPRQPKLPPMPENERNEGERKNAFQFIRMVLDNTMDDLEEDRCAASFEEPFIARIKKVKEAIQHLNKLYREDKVGHGS